MSEQASIEQFNAWAKTYDQKYGKAFAFWNQKIVDLLELQNGQSLLDVGCGTGILLEQLSCQNKDLKLHGIDISPEMVKYATEKLGESAAIKVGSVSNLPYKDNTFDYATCSTSFHHYPEPAEALKEIYRVLKPGGRFILLDPYCDGIMRKLICILLPILSNERNVHFFTKKQLTQMLTTTGFTHITQKSYWYKLITNAHKR